MHYNDLNNHFIQTYIQLYTTNIMVYDFSHILTTNCEDMQENPIRFTETNKKKLIEDIILIMYNNVIISYQT